MRISPEEVERIAHLARLALDPGELERLADQLSGILDHVRELDGLQLADVAPFESAAEDAADARADEPGPDPLQVPLDRIAVGMRGGFFTVPRLYALPDGEAAS